MYLANNYKHVVCSFIGYTYLFTLFTVAHFSVYIILVTMAIVTMELSFLLQVIQGGPLPPVPTHTPVSSLSGNSVVQLPAAVTPRVVYNEKVSIIWNMCWFIVLITSGHSRGC